MPEDLGVLQVDVVDLVGEIARGLHRVHELPDQVRGVELQADVGAVLERLEERLPTNRSGGDVRTAGIGLPQNAHLVFLAQRKIFLVVDADNLVHLFLQRAALDGAGLPADVGDAQLAAQLDALGGVLVLLCALAGVGIDMIAIASHRRHVEAGALNFVFDGGDRGVIHLVGSSRSCMLVKPSALRKSKLASE